MYNLQQNTKIKLTRIITGHINNQYKVLVNILY